MAPARRKKAGGEHVDIENTLQVAHELMRAASTKPARRVSATKMQQAEPSKKASTKQKKKAKFDVLATETSSSSSDGSSSESEDESEEPEEEEEVEKRSRAKGNAIEKAADERKKKRYLVSEKHTATTKDAKKQETRNDEDDPEVLVLISELLQGHETLKSLKQRDDPDLDLPIELIRLTTRLTVSEVLSSDSPRVRWLAAMCFADILYLHAPEAPFEDATLKRVFQLLVESLKGLGMDEGSEASMVATYVLDRMAVCKLGCILVDLPESLPGDGDIGTSELAQAMFDTIFDSIAPSHPLTIEHSAVELLAGYLEECSDENYPSAVLDSVLRRLLPDTRKESHRAYDVARGVIARCSERIRAPVSKLINGMLLGEFERMDVMLAVESSSVKDSVFAVVLELFRIDPNLLLHVLPSIENLLEVDVLESRVKAVNLLCEIFLEITSDSTILDFDRLFVSLVRRMLDKAVKVRAIILNFAGKCLTSPSVSKQLASMVKTRGLSTTTSEGSSTLLETSLHDTDQSLRSEAVEICSLVLSSYDQTDSKLSSGGSELDDRMAALAKSLSGRLHDVSVDISIRAMEGLAWAYSKNPVLLGWVPNSILSEDSKRESAVDYMRIDEARIGLIDQALLGCKQGETESRVENFFQLFLRLTSVRSKAQLFRCVFKLRSQIRAQMLSTLELRLSKKKVAEFPQELTGLIHADAEVWRLIWNVPDNRVLDRWSQLLNPLSSRDAMNEAKRDMTDRVGSALKSQKVDVEKINKCKSLVKSLCRWTGLWTLCSEELTSSAFLSRAKDPNLIGVIERFVISFPEAFQREDVLQKVAAEPIDESRLRIIAALACHVKFDPDEELATSLKAHLLRMASGGEESATGKKRYGAIVSNKSRKLATKALIKLFVKTAEGLFAEEEVMAELLPSNKSKWSTGDLYVALTATRLLPAFELSIKMIDLCIERAKKAYSQSTIDDDIDGKVVAIKLIVEFLLRATDDASKASESYCRNLLLMLRSFVSDMGDPWSGQANRSSKARVAVAWPPAAKLCFSRLRLAAATGLMKIEAAHSTSAILVEGDNELSQLKRQARRFVERSRLALDPSEANREMFLSKLSKIELDKGLNMHRDGAFLAIIGALHEGGQSSNRAAADLKQLVKFLAQKSEAHQLSDDVRAVMVAPELILSNLVYILAHHPLFPSEESDFADFLKSGQSILTGPMVLLVDSIVAAHGKAQHRLDASVRFMLALLSQIRTKRDVLDEHHGIYCVCDLARLVILEHTKYSPAALEPFKGRIPMPKVFLEASNTTQPSTPGQAATFAHPPSPVSYLPTGFELAVVSARKKSRTARKSAAVSSSKKPSAMSSKEKKAERKGERAQPRRDARRSHSYAEADSSDQEFSSSDSE